MNNYPPAYAGFPEDETDGGKVVVTTKEYLELLKIKEEAEERKWKEEIDANDRYFDDRD